MKSKVLIKFIAIVFTLLILFSFAACPSQVLKPHVDHDETVTATLASSGNWPFKTTISVVTTRPVKQDRVFAVSFNYILGNSMDVSIVIAKGGTSGSVAVNGAALGIENLKFKISGTNVYSFEQICTYC